ncbi:hypothetical protein MRS76_23435, partial [Rhizobiaceae bacterium n13]
SAKAMPDSDAREKPAAIASLVHRFMVWLLSGAQVAKCQLERCIVYIRIAVCKAAYYYTLN